MAASAARMVSFMIGPQESPRCEAAPRSRRGSGPSDRTPLRHSSDQTPIFLRSRPNPPPLRAFELRDAADGAHAQPEFDEVAVYADIRHANDDGTIVLARERPFRLGA